MSQTEEDQGQRTENVNDQRSKSSAKVVAVVDRTASISEAASACGMSRVSFNGRSVYAPDIVLVNEFVAEEFLLHIIQAVTSPLLKRSNTASSKVQPDSHTQTMKDLEGNEAYRVVMSGTNGSVVELKDR